MAFRFKLSEPFDEGARRIAVEQIERAQSLLHESGDQAVAVHETRKALKRLRALLRLIRPAIGEIPFKDENARLREIGLSLSGARDRHVMLETATKLAAGGGFGRRGVAESLRQSIFAMNGAGEPLSFAEATERFAAARQRLAEMPVSGTGFDVVGEGLELSYHQARRAFRAAYDEPSDEAFHEWRKGAQRHWRQMTLLSRAWPELIDARAHEARELSQLLGDDHDLAVLAQFVHSDQATGLRGEAVAVIESAARRRQQELRSSAKPRGERLFAESPRRLRRMICAYWDAAVQMKGLDEARSEAAPRRIRRKSSSPRRSPTPDEG